MTTAALLDLGVSDVHKPGVGVAKLDDMGGDGGVDMISAEKRKSLPEERFAIPSQRKYPIDTPARIRNAAARLEQMKKAGKVSDADYKAARGRIAKAAKSHGIESEYNASSKGADDVPLKKRSIHVRADLAPGGSLHVSHLKDGTMRAFLPAVAIDPSTAK